MEKIKITDTSDIITIEIPLVKKHFACCQCKYYGVKKETDSERPGFCSRLHKYTQEVALTCNTKKSWKKKGYGYVNS